VLRTGDIIDAIGDDDGAARVVEGLPADRRQVFTTARDNAAVDFNDVYACNAGMLEDTAQRTAVPAADNQDIARVSQCEQRHRGDHIVEHKFIAFGRLHDAVKRKPRPNRRFSKIRMSS
jgi:hypothetical protein